MATEGAKRVQTDDRDAGHDVALFRHGVIADVLRLPVGSPERAALVRAKAAQRYRIPHSRRTRIGENTIRRWVRSYRQGGFQALRPKPRSDRGRSRRIPVEVADVLKGIKEGNPRLSTRLVIVEARERGLVPARQKLAHETVHRLLANAGLTGERAKALEDCRHFCHEHANALWMSSERSDDIQYGNLADMGPAGRIFPSWGGFWPLIGSHNFRRRRRPPPTGTAGQRRNRPISTAC